METFLQLGDERARLSSRELPEVVETVARGYRAFAAGPGPCRWSLEIMRLGDRFGIQDENQETHRVETPFQAWATADRMLRVKYAGRAGRHRMLMHAAGVARKESGAVVILGSEDAGKSTLACALVAQGWHFLSDEMVPVEQDGQALAFPKLPDADPRMAQRIADAFGDLTGLTTGDDPNGYVDLPEHLILAPGATRPVRMLLFLRREESAGDPALQPFGGGQSALATVQAAFNCHILGEKSVWMATRLLQGARAWHLSYRDALTQAASISRLLERNLQEDPKDS